MNRRLFLLVGFCYFFTLLACTPKEEVSLTASDMVEVDTLYVKIFDNLKVEMDSLCEVKTDSMIKHFADSLLPIRLKQIIRQRQRKEQE